MRRRHAAVALGIVLGACGPGDGVHLGDPHVVTTATGVGVAPMLAVSGQGREAVAWISAPDGGTDGRLYVQVDGAPPVELQDPLGPIEGHAEAPPKLAFAADGSLHALYVVSKVVPGRRFPLGALRTVASADGGRQWGAPVTVTDDGDFGSHNFHALHAAPDGRLYVSWLDGRSGSSGAYLARSDDGGQQWSTNVRVSVEDACPCCRTALATGPDGVLYLAWRTVLPGNVRDIVVARSTDRGGTWSTPVRVHADDWVYDGCPHAGPSLTVDPEGRVHVAWWTGRSGAAGVHYAVGDAALRFGAPTAIATAPASRPSHPQVLLDGPRVLVAWDDGFTPTPAVHLRVSTDGGRTFQRRRTLSEGASVAMFPVLTRVRDGVRVAWTEESAVAHAHAAASAPDMRDPSAVKGLTPVGSGQVVARDLLWR